MTDDSSLRNTVQCESTGSSNLLHQSARPISALTGNPLLLTVLSAIAFVVAGAWAWSPKFVLLLFPILLLHELGHFAAMKLFGYQDVRLFFVPFLGAAVAGRSESGSIAQRITVCLAGPLPGIAIAIVLWISGLTTNNETVSAAVVMLLVINGFNLLPILPLDGGWLIQTLLLARRPWLELTFRCVTIAILLAIATATKTWLLALIAIPFATGLKSAFHFCRIQSRLASATTKMAFAENTPSNEMILQEVRNEFPGAILTEVTAQQWLRRIHSSTDAPKPNIGLAWATCTIVLITLIGSGFIVFELANKEQVQPTLQLEPWEHEY